MENRMRTKVLTEDSLKGDGVLCVNLDTMEFHHWDHYALASRGLPEGYKTYEDVSKIDLLNIILKLRDQKARINVI